MNGKLSRKQFLTLVVLVCGSFVTFLNQTLITPALSTIMVEFAIDTATVQWLVNGFTMVNAIMVPVTAFLIDNYTTRQLFTIAMSLFLGGSLLAAWGPSFLLLLGGRLLQAAGAGIIMPMVMTELMISFPPERRGQAMGVFGLVNAVAPSIGPTLSGVVIDYANWHVLFYIVSLLTLMGIIAGLVILKSSVDAPRSGRASIDKPSLASSSLGLALVLYGFSSLGSLGFSALTAAAILAGVVILVFFVRRQLVLDEPMLKLSILKNRRFAVATILCVIIQGAMMCAPVLVPIYIQTIRGFSATVSGLTLMPGAIAMALFNPIVGRLFDKYGPRALSVSGAFCMTAGTLMLAFFGLDTPLWLLTAVMAVRQCAIAFVNMPISTWGMNALDDDLMNHGSSINNTARMVAGSLGTAVIVSISSLATSIGNAMGMSGQEADLLGFNVAFGVSGFICAIGLVMCIALIRDRRASAEGTDISGERRSMLEQIMKRDVYTIYDTATVAEVAQLFIEKDVSAVPIVTRDGRAVGFVSDGDILRELSARNDREYVDPVSLLMRSSHQETDFNKKLNALMEQPVTTIGHMGIIGVDIHDRLSVVCRVLGDNHLKKVPVLHNGKIVGIINRSDITKFSMMQYMQNRENMLNAG